MEGEEQIVVEDSSSEQNLAQPQDSGTSLSATSTTTASDRVDSHYQPIPVVNIESCEDDVQSEPEVEPPSPCTSLYGAIQRQIKKFPSSASIASEEEEEAKTFESHFETMSEEAESILKTEPVADIVKNLDVRLTPKLPQKYAAKNKSTASSLASEEEAEATIFEGHFETVAEEATTILESVAVAPIVAELHEKAVERRGAPVGANIDYGQMSKSEGETRDDELLETLQSMESEASESEDLLDVTEEMDDWRPRGMERRRGEELPTPFLVRKKRRKQADEPLETEVSEFEEHERRLEQLSNNIDKILAPLAANEKLDDDEDILQVAIFAPLAKCESLHSLCSEVASSSDEICVIEVDEEDKSDRPNQLSFCSRLCSPSRWWLPWRRSSEAEAFSWFSPFRFLTATVS